MGIALSHISAEDSYQGNINKNSFDAKSMMMDVKLGAIWWFTKKGIRPYLHAGLNYSNLMNLKGNYNYWYKYMDGTEMKYFNDEMRTRDFFYHNYWGVYGGAGIDFPIGKRAIYVQGTYTFRKRETIKITSCDVQLGLRF